MRVGWRKDEPQNKHTERPRRAERLSSRKQARRATQEALGPGLSHSEEKLRENPSSPRTECGKSRALINFFNKLKFSLWSVESLVSLTETRRTGRRRRFTVGVPAPRGRACALHSQEGEQDRKSRHGSPAHVASQAATFST